jgi:endonuclease-3
MHVAVTGGSNAAFAEDSIGVRTSTTRQGLPLVSTEENARARCIVDLLESAYPEKSTTLLAKSPLQLLVATILSAQSTDAQVNRVTRQLFRKYRSVQDFAGADLEQLQHDIFEVGYYRQKARFVQAACRKLLDQFNGKVPRTMEELLQLPGVGRKTANIVLSRAFGVVEGIAVDTHVFRIARRLDLSIGRTPEQVERDLMERLPQDTWSRINQLFITHGRRLCLARHPKCDLCPLKSLCPFPALTRSTVGAR